MQISASNKTQTGLVMHRVGDRVCAAVAPWPTYSDAQAKPQPVWTVQAVTEAPVRVFTLQWSSRLNRWAHNEAFGRMAKTLAPAEVERLTAWARSTVGVAS